MNRGDDVVMGPAKHSIAEQQDVAIINTGTAMAELSHACVVRMLRGVAIDAIA